MSDDHKRAVLRESIVRKKECQNILMKIVEDLIENPVEESYLKEKAITLDPTTYQDVVVERAIQQLCGYPLCQNMISDVPRQQFKISVKSRKVYDITDRKNYCCNGCYQASVHLKEQLLTSPIWSRDFNEKLKLSLKPHGTLSNLVGEEVRIHTRLTPKDIEFVSILDAVSSLPDDAGELDAEERERPQDGSALKEENISEGKTTMSFLRGVVVEGRESKTQQSVKVETRRDDASLLATDDEINGSVLEVSEQKRNESSLADEVCASWELKSLKSQKVATSSEVSCVPLAGNRDVTMASVSSYTPKDTKTEKETSTAKRKVISPRKARGETKQSEAKDSLLTSLRVEEVLKGWFTVGTLRYILSNTVVDAILAERDLTESNVEFHQDFEEKYSELCGRLDRMDVMEGVLDSKSDGAFTAPQLPSRPLPSYDELRKETEQASVKVAAFMSGKATVENSIQKLEIKEKTEDKDDSEKEKVRMPPIDSRSQNMLRRQIVLGRLHSVFPDLMRTFNLGNMDIADLVRELSATFKFSADNIVHEPHHWSLIGLSIIYFTSRRDPVLKRKIAADAPQKYIKMMLYGFNLDAGYLERLLTWLTDVTMKSFS